MPVFLTYNLKQTVMEKKFSKGNWHSFGYRVDVDVADGLSGVCEMLDWMGRVEMEANSKLIAAAPELLEALECVYGLLKIQKHMFDDYEIDILNKVENAIKKATE